MKKKACRPVCPTDIRRFFWVWVAALLGAKCYLMTGLIVRSAMADPFDDGQEILSAVSLSHFKWLGSFTEFTLEKGPMFSFYLAALNQLGIPYLLGNTLLCFAAALAVAWAFRRLFNSYAFAALLYSVILFMPLSYGYNAAATRTYRDAVAPYFFLLLAAAVLFVYLHRKDSWKRLTFQCILAGMAGSANLLLREDAMWMMPLLFGGLAVTVFSCRRQGGKALLRSAAAAAFVPLIMAGSVLSVSAVNYRYYGYYGVTDMMSGNLPKMMEAMESIQPDVWIAQVPVPLSTREKIYRISPTFAKLKAELEDPNIGVRDPAGCKDSCQYLVWNIRMALPAAGYITAKQQQAFYAQVTKDISKAFQKNELKRRGGYVHMFVSPWDARYVRPVIRAFLNGLKDTAFIREAISPNYIPSPDGVPVIVNGESSGTAAARETAQSFLRSELYAEGLPLPADGAKIKLLRKIARGYVALAKPVAAAGLLSFFFLTVFLFRHRRSKQRSLASLRDGWLILTGLLLTYLLHIGVLAYTDVAGSTGIVSHYMAPSYYTFSIFAVGSVFAAFQCARPKMRSLCSALSTKLKAKFLHIF